MLDKSFRLERDVCESSSMISPEFIRLKIFSLSGIQQFLNFQAALPRNFYTCTVNVPFVPVSKFWEVLVE